MRRTLAIAAALACLSARAPARAAEAVTYSLGWTRLPGAESCVGSRTLAARVDAELGYTRWAPAAAASVAIEGYVERSANPDRWHVHLALVDTAGATLGERDLTSEEQSCDALADPLVLTVALIIDPNLMSGAEKHGPAEVAALPVPPPPAAAPAPQPLSSAASADRRPPPARTADHASPRVETRVAAAMALGLLPGIASGLEVEQAMAFAPLVLELGSTLWLPREASGTGGRGATFSLLTLGARACPLRHWSTRLALRGCVGAEAGVLLADGYHFDHPEHAGRPAAFLSLAGRAEIRVAGPVWLGVGLSAGVPLLREPYVFTDENAVRRELFRISPLFATAGASSGVAF